MSRGDASIRLTRALQTYKDIPRLARRVTLLIDGQPVRVVAALRARRSRRRTTGQLHDVDNDGRHGGRSDSRACGATRCAFGVSPFALPAPSHLSPRRRTDPFDDAARARLDAACDALAATDPHEAPETAVAHVVAGGERRLVLSFARFARERQCRFVAALGAASASAAVLRCLHQGLVRACLNIVDR